MEEGKGDIGERRGGRGRERCGRGRGKNGDWSMGGAKAKERRPSVRKGASRMQPMPGWHSQADARELALASAC